MKTRARRRLWGLLCLVSGLAAAVATAAPAIAASSAVIVMYHRFGEDTLSSTNTRIEQFEAHIDELSSGGYPVLPVPDIVAALRTGATLPDRTVGITVDDAFMSVYQEAWPRLKAAGLPFTLFVSTNPIDSQAHGMMSWDQIRELADAGVTIGHHGAAHAHMAEAGPEANAADIAKATRRFQAELGRVPELFAYPYGEFSRSLAEMVSAAGFTAAFGQHSGVAHEGPRPCPCRCPTSRRATRYWAPTRRRSASPWPRALPGLTASTASPRARGRSPSNGSERAASRCGSRRRSRPAARASTARCPPPTAAGAGLACNSWCPTADPVPSTSGWPGGRRDS